jgi:hypothetical protein
MRVESENNIEVIIKWFENEVQNGENSIIVYPNLQSFRQIYINYLKDHLVAAAEAAGSLGDSEGGEGCINYSNNKLSEKSANAAKTLRKIILIAPFYETVESVKHHIGGLDGMQDIQSLIDEGSLLLVDAFHSYFPDMDGMKKLVSSLSDRAKKEGRGGVITLVDMGTFFLFGGDGKATELIKYEASLPSKTQGGNVRGFSCYHVKNYDTLKDSQKEELAQKCEKKLLRISESSTTTS